MTHLRHRVGAFLLAGALVTAAPAARAQNSHMDHHQMAGMSTELPPVSIPKGAIFTEADVRFMQGMIAHHAQAIYMSRMAAAHDASPRLRQVRQQDRPVAAGRDPAHAGLAAAPTASSRPTPRRGGTMSMPGMLTAEQLDAARRGQGRGVRSPVPHVHDSAPRGRAQDGERPLRHPARRSGRRRLGVRERRPDGADRRDRHDAPAC